jgi:hypothetical protein
MDSVARKRCQIDAIEFSTLDRKLLVNEEDNFFKICKEPENIGTFEGVRKKGGPLIRFRARGGFREPELLIFRKVWGTLAENWGGVEVYIFLLLVADVTPLQHVQKTPVLGRKC